MSKRSIETMVGAFVLLGLGALLFLALKAANLASFGDQKGYTLAASSRVHRCAARVSRLAASSPSGWMQRPSWVL
jgi:hypothetical protein